MRWTKDREEGRCGRAREGERVVGQHQWLKPKCSIDVDAICCICMAVTSELLARRTASSLASLFRFASARTS